MCDYNFNNTSISYYLYHTHCWLNKDSFMCDYHFSNISISYYIQSSP